MGNCHLWCQIFTFTSVYDIFHLTLQFLPLKGLNIFPGSLPLDAAVWLTLANVVCAVCVMWCVVCGVCVCVYVCVVWMACLTAWKMLARLDFLFCAPASSITRTSEGKFINPGRTEGTWSKAEPSSQAQPRCAFPQLTSRTTRKMIIVFNN